MNSIMKPLLFNNSVRVLALAVWFGCSFGAQAQPTIVTYVPSSAATGVSPSAPVVFTFSEAMDTANTDVQFFVPSPLSFPATSNSWTAGDTVLTCTPTPAFPANNTIFWTVSGQNPAGDPLGGTTDDFFSTGSSGGGGGSGTNKITTFSVGKIHLFNQTNTSAPVLDPDIPYFFSGNTTLASNRTATSITLTRPTTVTSSLTPVFGHPEQFSMYATDTNLANFDATFPAGNYVFNVTGSSNQIVTNNLSASLVQPNAPHISNFTPAQSVNATQAFVLSWDAFSGGTAADYIYVTVGSVFNTTNLGTAGALNGTATSVSIPANTLQANSNYDSSIGFYRAVVTSNATYSTISYLASSTRFSLVTSSGSSAVTLRLTNGVWAGNAFSLDVTGPPSQAIVVQYSSTLLSNSWNTVLNTNIPAGGRVHLTDPHSVSNRYLFYRAKTGP